MKYAVHAGHVISPNDGDFHFISAYRVAELYGIPRSECVFLDVPENWLGRDLSGMIHLYPQADGKYQL